MAPWRTPATRRLGGRRMAPLLRAPVAAASNCIAVSYRGPRRGADVRLSATSTGTGLDSDLDLTVEEGSGGGFNDCTRLPRTPTVSGLAGGRSRAPTGTSDPAWRCSRQ